jgi:hypothetical protein
MQTIRTTESYILGSVQFNSLIQSNTLRPGTLYVIEDLNEVRVATSRTTFDVVGAVGSLPVADAVFPVAELTPLPAATGSVDFVDIEEPTVDELLSFCVEINSKVGELIFVLKEAGLMDDPQI